MEKVPTSPMFRGPAARAEAANTVQRSRRNVLTMLTAGLAGIALVRILNSVERADTSPQSLNDMDLPPKPQERTEPVTEAEIQEARELLVHTLSELSHVPIEKWNRLVEYLNDSIDYDDVMTVKVAAERVVRWHSRTSGEAIRAAEAYQNDPQGTFVDQVHTTALYLETLQKHIALATELPRYEEFLARSQGMQSL